MRLPEVIAAVMFSLSCVASGYCIMLSLRGQPVVLVAAVLWAWNGWLCAKVLAD